MCLENHSEDLTLDISQDTNDLKVKKKQKKNKVTSAIKYFLNILCCPRSRTSETCRFWCYPTGQTPCCIHTEQPGWVLAPCAGCHLWEGEKANMTGITSPRGEPQSAHHSQLSYSLIASTSSWFPTARALSNDSLMRLPAQSDLRPLSVFKKI